MSLRTRVLGLLVLALLLSLAIDLLAASTIRRLALENSEERALALIRSATRAQDDVFERTRLVLEAAVASPVVRAGRSDPTPCNAHLLTLASSVSGGLSFILLDATGRPVCSSVGVDTSIDFSDRSWFTRPLERGTVALGDYLVSRVSGEALIVLGHPVALPGGTGVLGAGINLAWFAGVIDQATLPEGAQVTVVDGEGTVLTSFPDNFGGETFGDATLLERIRSSEIESFTHGRGGDATLVFSESLSDLTEDVRLIATLPAASVLAPARAFANRTLLLLAGTFVLALTAMTVSLERWILRPVGVLVGAFARVSSGELTTRLSPDTRIPDFQRVALGFNAMTDALQSREQALQTSELRYRLLVESLTSGVVLQQADGTISTVNRSACEILGLSAEELLGERQLDPRWRAVREDGSPFPLDERPATVALATGAPQSNVTMGVHRPDGSHAWLLIDSRPLVAEPGPPATAVVSTFTDITDRVEAQARLVDYAAELERSNRELEQFAYIASHDLREPLRVIAGYTQLLERRYGDSLDDTAREFIAFAVDGVDRMRQLIDDLLAFSRAGSREFSREPVDLAAVVERVRADLAVSLEETGARLMVGELPTVRADPTQIRQLFQNLIANAVKFRSDRPPCIRICAERSTEGWSLSVSDNGIGVDPQFAERIFVIFQRLHTHDRYEGTGIGLALCRRIVERHGGTIGITSQEGNGSVFTVTLPD